MQASTQPLPDGDEAEEAEQAKKQAEATEPERVKQRQEAEQAKKQAEAAEAAQTKKRQEFEEAERAKKQAEAAKAERVEQQLKEAEEAERVKKQLKEAEDPERVKQREEFEEAMDRWRLPPELDEEVRVLVAQYADLGLGDFADLSNGGGFKIQDTARRATSLRQLIALAAHIIRRVEVNREEWSMKKYVDGVATDHCVTSAYEVCTAAKRGAG